MMKDSHHLKVLGEGIGSPMIRDHRQGLSHQTQPLQARSSNSGTSFKKSDNSHSSYPGLGDTTSEQAHLWLVPEANTYPKPEPGQLTQVFSKVGQPVQAASGRQGILKTTGSPKKPNPKGQAQGPSATSTVRTSTSSSRARINSGLTDPKHVVAPGSTKESLLQSSLRLITDTSGSETRSGATIGKKTLASKPLTKNQRDESAKDTSFSAVDALRTQRQTKSEANPPMRQTRSKSKTLAVSAVDEGEEDLSHTEMPGFCEGQNAEKLSNIDLKSNGQSGMIAFIDMDEADIGKYEIGMRLNLDCEAGEESKCSKMDEPYRRTSHDISDPKRASDRQNISYQVSESAESLADNPLSQLIKQFQNQRINAQLSGKQKPTIQQFLDCFEKEMVFLEDSYQAQVAARREQMRVFEQNYGVVRTAKGQLPPNQLSTNLQTTAGVSRAPLVDQASSSQVGARDFSDMTHNEHSIPVSMGPHGEAIRGVTHEDGSMVSNQSYFNQQLASHVGAPLSEMSVSEVYESYQFMQNSLISFYPKDVRRCIQRRKTLNSNQLSTDKLLNSLRPPKHTNKTRKLATKMNSLALCQVNMMQVLLQKISRKSKVIRKQEKIVNENLKRKRIYLESEKFDIISVLRQTVKANEKSSAKGNKRHHSPNSGRHANPGSQVTRHVSPKKTCVDDLSVEDQLMPKQSQKHSTQEVRNFGPSSPLAKPLRDLGFHLTRNSPLLQNSQSTAMPADNTTIANQPQQSKKAPKMVEVLKTPERNPKKAALNDHQYLQAEKKVQQALNLSEIESSFLRASKNFSQHREDSLSASHETQNLPHLPTLNPDFMAADYAMQHTTPHTETCQASGSLNHANKLQLTAAGPAQQPLLATDQLGKKNFSTQVKIRRVVFNDQVDIPMEVDNSVPFKERLEESHGNFAIANLGRNRGDESSIKIKLPEVTPVAPSEADNADGGQSNRRRRNNTKSLKIEGRDSEVKGKKNSVQKQVQGSDQPLDNHNLSFSGKKGSQVDEDNHLHGDIPALKYSQSVHIPHHNLLCLNEAPFTHAQQVGDMEHYESRGKMHHQDLTVQQMMLHPMFDIHQIQRHQSVLVPPPSFMPAGVAIDDMFFEESHPDLASLDPNTQSNANMGSYSHAANPYEVAKRSYFAEQKKQQANQNRQASSSAERMHLVKQQVSEPTSNFTVQELSHHSLQQVKVPQVEQCQAVSYISPMHLSHLQQSTPMNKLNENIQMVDAGTTPSKFMHGAEANHLCLPYMTNNQSMLNYTLMLSSGYRDRDESHLGPMMQMQMGNSNLDNSAASGASVFLKCVNYTPGAMLVTHHVAEANQHRENLMINAWRMDDNDTATAHMVETLIGNSAKTISEDKVRQHSSSQQRSVEDVDLFTNNVYQQNQYM